MHSLRSKNSCCHLVAVIITLIFFVTSSPRVASKPIFGTKRYHRNPSAQQHPQQLPQYVAQPLPAAMQLYAPVHQSTAGAGATLYDPMDSYYSDDPSNYLYYAPHDPQYHSYGLPVYHGDYKPTPYMYAQAPTYQYYDEKESAINPLDDLHEEMLEEDEREREQKQQQLLHQQQLNQYRQQQQQFNAHNNRQLNSGRPEVQENDDYQDMLAGQAYYYQPIYEAPQQSFPTSAEYEDEEENIMDSNYAQANAAFLKDLIQYNREISNGRGNTKPKAPVSPTSHAAVNARNQNVQASRKDYPGNWGFDYAGDEYEPHHQQQDDYDYGGQYFMEQPMKTKTGHKSGDDDDKAVKELQELTHSRDKTSPDTLFASTPGQLRHVDPMDKYKSHNQAKDSANEDYLNWISGGGGSSFSEMDKNSELNSNNNYDYDDAGDEWINWDSKRSVGKPISIIAFTDRKPSKVMKVPENHFVLSSSGGASTDKGDTSPTSTLIPPTGLVEKLMSSSSGQKEEVLMRPAPPVRNPFSAPVMKMLQHQESLKTNKYEPHAAVEDLENKKRSVKDNKSSSSSERKPKATMYDTIKQLLDMEQQLQKEVSQDKLINDYSLLFMRAWVIGIDE